MSELRGYKDAEFGLIPDNWQIIKFKDLVESSKLGTNDTSNSEEGLPLVKMGNLTFGGFNFKKIEHINAPEKDYNEFLLNKGDFLFNTRNTPQLVGKCAVWNNHLEKAIYNNNIMKIVFKEVAIPDYISYQFNNGVLKPTIRGLATGTTSVAAIYWKDLSNVRVPLPTVGEQQKIVSVLSSIGRVMEKTEAIIEQTEKVKKGLMQQLLTKGIEHTKYKRTEIGEVPETWSVKKVEEIGTVRTGGTPRRDEAENYGGSIPWVKTTEIKYNLIVESEEYITEYALENSAAKIYPRGTVLLAMYGQGATRGRCAILGIDAAINQACAAIVVKTETINKFLYYVLELNYEKLRNLGHGSNQSNLNTQLVKSFLIPVPPMHEQEKIIKIISSTENKLIIETRNLEELKKLKIGLMQSLLTGKVRVKANEAEVTQV
ncbi:restriction endonuclease subunit S [Priestia aryabhattai]|uniref:restriction endonuclease subunit S n=1 Tax=Priestia aryabhattai TaxID=412384 RepID=UPI003D2A79AE